MAALPKLCCLTPYVLQGEPRGKLEDASTNPGLQLKRYHAKPSTGASQAPKTAIVLLYDVFGFNLPNAKLLADEFADRLGVDVSAPDYIPRPPHIEPFLPIVEIAPDQLANSGQSMIAKVINTIWAVFKSLPYLPEVLDYFVMPRVHKALADLKAEGYENLGVIGYCRGGGVAIRLLAEHAQSVKCGIICHPGPLYQSLWPSIEAPTAWHLAEKDNWMTDEHLAVLVRLAAKKQAQGQTFEQTGHLGTTHGFASRPNTGHDPSMVAFENVKDDTVRFFKEHLGLQ